MHYNIIYKLNRNLFYFYTIHHTKYSSKMALDCALDFKKYYLYSFLIKIYKSYHWLWNINLTYYWIFPLNCFLNGRIHFLYILCGANSSRLVVYFRGRTNNAASYITLGFISNGYWQASFVFTKSIINHSKATKHACRVFRLWHTECDLGEQSSYITPDCNIHAPRRVLCAAGQSRMQRAVNKVEQITIRSMQWWKKQLFIEKLKYIFMCMTLPTKYTKMWWIKLKSEIRM